MAKEPITQLDYQESNSLRTDALQNAELNYYSAWINPVVLAVGQAAPMGTEDDGDRYIVGVGTGDFAGHDDELAVLRSGVWQFYAPLAAGVPLVKNLDDGADWEYVSGAWAAKGASVPGGSVSYDNTTSGLAATNVQDALDEVAASVVAGSAGRHAIWIPAGAMSPSATGGCAALATVASAANQPDIQSLDFDATTAEYAQFALRMPKSWDEGTVTFVPVWSHAATTTDFGVAWTLQGVAVSDGDPIAVAYGTAQASVDTGGTTNDIYIGPESAAITLAGTPAEQDMVFFRLARLTTDAGDTMAIDARLHGVTVYMTTDASTDA